MIWKQTTGWQWLSGANDYIIERDKNYRYQSSHVIKGNIKKYRLLEGAQRAAERHANGERK